MTLSITVCTRAGDGNVSLLFNLTLLFASLAHSYKWLMSSSEPQEINFPHFTHIPNSFFLQTYTSYLPQTPTVQNQHPLCQAPSSTTSLLHIPQFLMHPSFQTFGETLRGTDWLTLSTSQSCLLQDMSGHRTSTDTTFVEQGGGRVNASALQLIAQSTMSHGHYRQSCQFIYSPKNLLSKELLLPGIGR